MHNEKVFTPNWMVKIMLNKLQYFGNGILQKHIIDNSCGKGAFLAEIVDRYCKAFLEAYGTKSNLSLKQELETYIHGIEIDETCWGLTIVNLNRVGLKYDLENVEWDIKHGDALEIDEYNGKMDYVVGNPPYCNVHHFGDKYDTIKKFSFAQGGMADLYLVFFEIGINMLNDAGKLIYITPSSWTTSIAGKPFRKYLIENDKLSEVITLGHEKVFPDATTFTIVTVIEKIKGIDDEHEITLYKYDSENNCIDYIATRPLHLFTVGDSFYFDDDVESIRLIKEIEKHDYEDLVKVKNGFATLNDKLFVIDEDIQENDPRFGVKDIIPAIKASTGEEKWMVFPYDRKNGNKPFKFEELSDVTKKYLLKRARQLNMEEKGKMTGEWWLYGRTQAINDYGKDDRYAINNLIRNKKDIKINDLLHITGVYSGYYIIAGGIKLTIVDCMKYLYNDTFVNYVKTLGKYKNGGYYTFSSKDLQNFLNYQIKNSDKN